MRRRHVREARRLRAICRDSVVRAPARLLPSRRQIVHDVEQEREPDERVGAQSTSGAAGSCSLAGARSTGTNSVLRRAAAGAAATRASPRPRSAGRGTIRRIIASCQSSRDTARSSSVRCCSSRMRSVSSSSEQAAGTPRSRTRAAPRIAGPASAPRSSCGCIVRQMFDRPVDERHVGHAEEREAGRQLLGAGAAVPAQQQVGDEDQPQHAATMSAARPTATRRPTPCAPTAAR